MIAAVAGTVHVQDVAPKLLLNILRGEVTERCRSNDVARAKRGSLEVGRASGSCTEPSLLPPG
jgi:hypothetical protein